MIEARAAFGLLALLFAFPGSDLESQSYESCDYAGWLTRHPEFAGALAPVLPDSVERVPAPSDWGHMGLQVPAGWGGSAAMLAVIDATGAVIHSEVAKLRLWHVTAAPTDAQDSGILSAAEARDSLQAMLPHVMRGMKFTPGEIGGRAVTAFACPKLVVGPSP